MIADEIVIDDEDFITPAQLAQSVELRDELRVRLGARLAAVDGDDVAELTLEGAATGELHRHGGVFVETEEIEARHGARGHVRLFDDAVERLRSSLFECFGDGGEGFLGLAHHDMVGKLEDNLRTGARPRASDEGAAAESTGAQ